MSKSTRSTSKIKPAKPRPDFPLFAHDNGHWAKKIRGTLRYFGQWADLDAAQCKYAEQKEDLHARRKPRIATYGYRSSTPAMSSSRRKGKLDAGELPRRTWHGY